MTKYVIFIGIDISKQWFDVALYWSGLNAPYPMMRFDNDQAGFASFLQWVQSQADRYGRQGRWYICMEHTGIYGLALAHYLDQRQLTVVMECPLRIERSMGLRRGKSDPADAKAIARYALRNHSCIKVRPLPSPVLLQVQTLLSLRQRLVRYQHGLSVAAKELQGFVDPSIGDDIARHTQTVCQPLASQIKVIDQQVRQLLCRDDQLKACYQLVSSVIGIGPLITAYLIVYTNGFTAFEKARQFCCYIGVAPFPHTSGSSLQQPNRVSYLANKRLKALISTAATVAVNHDPEFKAFFQKKKAQGKDHGWIYNVIKNKIIHRVFAVVKRGTPFVRMNRHLG